MISGMRVRRRSSTGASLDWVPVSELVRVNESTTSLANVSNNPGRPVVWHPEGLYIFVPYHASTSNSGVQRHTLSTPWDISTVQATAGRLRQHLSNYSNRNVLWFDATGTKAIIQTAATVLTSYTMSTPWDINTLTSIGTYTVPGNIPYGGAISENGRTIVYSSTQADFRPTVQLVLSTPWDVSTASEEVANLELLDAGPTGYHRINIGAQGRRGSLARYINTSAANPLSVTEGSLKGADFRTWETIEGAGFAPTHSFTRTPDGRHLLTFDPYTNRLIHYDVHPGFSGFTDPTSLSGLQLWLDAADESTVTINSGTFFGRDGVIEWHDKSPHGTIFRPTNQSSLSPSRPYYDTTLNGLNVVRMVGSDKQYLYPSTGTAAQWSWLHDGTPHTIFCLFKRSVNQSQGVLGTNTTANAENGIGFNIRTSTDFPTVVIHQVSRGATGSVVYNSSVSGSIDTDEWMLLTVKVEPSNPYADKRSIMRKNGYHLESSSGATAVPSASDPSSLLNVGAFGEGAASMTGEIAEVIIYDRKLIQEEIDAVETYLKNKWGL